MSTKKIYSKGAAFVLCLFTLMIFAGACTHQFEKYNTNPHEVTDEMLSWRGLYVGSKLMIMQRNIVMFADNDNLDSDYQIAQNLNHDIYSGYMAPTIGTNGGSHNGTYNFIENWYQLYFNNAYLNIMQPWAKVRDFHQENNIDNEMAIMTIMKVLGMSKVTDTYGPIPYLNFILGSMSNEYNDVEDIYNEFFDELDFAITTLTNLGASTDAALVLEKYDLMYGGNVVNWAKFANTLRLRLALRVSNVDENLAKAQVQAAMDNPYGFIENYADRASLRHEAISYYHPLQVIADNFGDTRPGASIISYMNGYNDPRRATYFTQATQSQGGNTVPGYYGVRLGILTTNWSNYVGDRISSLNIQSETTEISFIKASESYFLRAECALKGWISGDAQTYYEDGVKMSFIENGITESEAVTYLAGNSAPTGFVDNSGSGANIVGMGGTEFDNIGVAWSNDGYNYQRIITQKWIALFPDGPEAWAEYRRTGYPYLFPTMTNQSGGTINDNLQICRLPYPRTEYDTNNAGVSYAVNSFLGGSDNGGVQLWWDRRGR